MSVSNSWDSYLRLQYCAFQTRNNIARLMWIIHEIHNPYTERRKRTIKITNDRFLLKGGEWKLEKAIQQNCDMRMWTKKTFQPNKKAKRLYQYWWLQFKRLYVCGFDKTQKICFAWVKKSFFIVFFYCEIFRLVL